MKNLTVLLAALFISLGIFAQGTTTANTKTSQTTTAATTPDKMKDGCMMKDNKMMWMKDGKWMAMDKDMTLKNGAIVSTDGTVKMKNGKTFKIKNGEGMDMNGMMTKEPMMKGETKTK